MSDIEPVEYSPSNYPAPPEQEQVSSVTKEEFNQALSLIEQFYEVLEKLKDLEQSAPSRLEADFKQVITDYTFLLEILDSESSPVNIIKNPSLSGNLRKNKVEKLGLSGELIRLRKEQRLTITELSDRYKLDKNTISRFFRYYDSLLPSQKAVYQRKSIFDVTERLEEMQQLILRNFYRLEGVSDDVAVKYMGELRQSLDLAVKVAEKINNAKEMWRKYEDLKKAVYDILVDELPDKRKEILLRVKSLGDSELSS